MVGARSGRGSVWFLLLRRGTGLVRVVFLQTRERERKQKSRTLREGVVLLKVGGFFGGGLILYLKRGPVHEHPGTVVVAEPLQVLLCVGAQDGAFQFSVDCGVAEERRNGTSSETHKWQKGGPVPNWQQKLRWSSTPGLRRSQHPAHRATTKQSVSPSFLPKLELWTDDVTKSR